MAITFNVSLFRSQFSAYSDSTAYTDETLQAFFDIATCYVSDDDYGLLSGACRLRALNLMTAHLLSLDDSIKSGDDPGLVTSSTIGRVSVSVKPTPSDEDQWSWWHNLTPYGRQLLALLAAKSVAGFYIGGRNERSSFRKSGGFF